MSCKRGCSHAIVLHEDSWKLFLWEQRMKAPSQMFLIPSALLPLPHLLCLAYGPVFLVSVFLGPLGCLSFLPLTPGPQQYVVCTWVYPPTHLCHHHHIGVGVVPKPSLSLSTSTNVLWWPLIFISSRTFD